MRTWTRIIMVGALFLAGCSWQPTRYVLTGSVTIDGVPAAYTTISFTPANGADPKNGGLVTSDKDGRFTLGEDGKNAGLPGGEYKVTFSQTLINGKPSLGGSGGKKSEQLPTEREAVPATYRSPQTTPETVTVGSSSRTFTFAIKTR
jgi:hypothetical protein